MSRLVLASVNQTPFDWSGNQQRIVSAVKCAKFRGASLVCFGEMSLTGYGCEDVLLGSYFAERALQELKGLAKWVGDCFLGPVVVGAPLTFEGSLYCCAVVLFQGKIVGVVPKRRLCDSEVYYESRWFRPWLAAEAGELDLGDAQSCPIGLIRFACKDMSFGLEICQDSWEDIPATKAAFTLSINASHSFYGKIDRRIATIGARAQKYNQVYGICNLLGCESGRLIFDGASSWVAPEEIAMDRSGLLRMDSPFSWNEFSLCEIDSRDIPSEIDARGDEPQAVVELGWALSSEDTKDRGAPPSAQIPSEFEQFVRASSLGLWDYLRKCNAKGFAISLSGGIDSAVTAVLASYVLSSAYRTKSPGQLEDVFGFVPQSKDELLRRALVMVYQKTNCSSEQTELAAKELAAELGGSFSVVDVQEQVVSQRQLAEKFLSRELTWESDDLTLQNIQARVRSVLVWTLANSGNLLLLTTGNRSEAAVGYCTMDGDTAGGLAPLAGVSKRFLQDFVVELSNKSIAGLGPIGALGEVLAKPPSAELRPGDEEQTDEGDLMPYELLEFFEEHLVWKRRSPRDIITLAAIEFADRLSHSQVEEHMERFVQLFSRSQWKRERLAPSFHLGSYSLDPKSCYRFPILNQFSLKG